MVLMLLLLAFGAAARPGTANRTAWRDTDVLPARDSIVITIMAMRVAEIAAVPNKDHIGWRGGCVNWRLGGC